MTLTARHLDFIEDGMVGLRGRDRAPEKRTWATPGHLARELDPLTRQTSALDLIDQVLVDVDAGRRDRVIISMPPQEGKSTRVTKVGPVWMLTRNPQRRIVIACYGQSLANEFGHDTRSIVATNQGGDGTLDLGLRIAKDNGAVSDWKLAGHRGGIRSVGIGGGLTGRPADVMFIDDPIKNRAEAESAVFRKRAKDFWTSTASTRLAPGAPVVIVLTRWHEDDLAGWLLDRPDGDRWHVINIPAQADHDPAEGESDPLGREPGQYMVSARVNETTGRPRSDAEWEQIKVQAGPADWSAMYQGDPTPGEGNKFLRTKWQTYETPLWIDRGDGAKLLSSYDGILASWDMAFKDLDDSDYVVGQVWMRRGANAFLLDQVRARMDFPSTLRAVVQLAAKWPQALMKLVEAKANGPAVMAMLSNNVPGLIPVEPEGGKVVRAIAVTPLHHAGNLWLPSPRLAPWIGEFIEEAAQFPNGAHDDQVDAMTQALQALVIDPLIAGDVYTEDDLDEDLADFRISPYG